MELSPLLQHGIGYETFLHRLKEKENENATKRLAWAGVRSDANSDSFFSKPVSELAVLQSQKPAQDNLLWSTADPDTNFLKWVYERGGESSHWDFSNYSRVRSCLGFPNLSVLVAELQSRKAQRSIPLWSTSDPDARFLKRSLYKHTNGCWFSKSLFHVQSPLSYMEWMLKDKWKDGDLVKEKQFPPCVWCKHNVFKLTHIICLQGVCAIYVPSSPIR